MCVAKRIKEIADFEGISIAEIERSIGASNGVISKAVKNGTDIQSKWVASIIENYLSYSPEWLLTGKGDMLRNASEVEVVKSLHTPKNQEPLLDIQSIPLYAFEATAGILAQGDVSEYVIDYLKIPNMPRCDGAVTVVGDSMYPIIKSGDIVLFKVYDDVQNIIWGQMYLVSLTIEGDPLILIKYVKKVEDNPKHILLVSHNQHHAPLEVSLSCVRSIALIKASIRYHIM